jgi:hypothetical protein
VSDGSQDSGEGGGFLFLFLFLMIFFYVSAKIMPSCLFCFLVAHIFFFVVMMVCFCISAALESFLFFSSMKALLRLS